MKAYKLIIAIAVSFICLSVSAQNGRDRHQTNWFIGGGAGMNFGFDGQTFNTNHDLKRENSHIGAGTAADFYIGKYFSDYIGFRIGYQGFKTSNQFTDYNRNPFHYAHADLIWRAGKVFTPYIHAGYAWMSNGTPAGGIGVMLPIRLGDRVSIIPDLKATALSGAAFPEGVKKLGFNLSATVGLQIALGKIKKKAAPAPAVVPVPVPEPKEEPAPEPVKEPEPKPVEVVVKEKEEQINRSLEEVVLFETNSYKISKEASVILDDAVKFLKEYPATSAYVEGHTDSTGGDKLNMDLSINRAKAVADYLIDNGIDASRVSSEGFGKTKPVTTNKTKEGRAQNRRVEIHIDVK